MAADLSMSDGHLRAEAGYERFLDKLGRLSLLNYTVGKHWECDKEMETQPKAGWSRQIIGVVRDRGKRLPGISGGRQTGKVW